MIIGVLQITSVFYSNCITSRKDETTTMMITMTIASADIYASFQKNKLVKKGEGGIKQ
jgi:hypothetical protein